MATPKQTRDIMRRIYLHTRLLQKALNEAHDKEVIKYEGKYEDEAPCWAMDRVRDRVNATTKEARARSFTDEIKATIKNDYH